MIYIRVEPFGTVRITNRILENKRYKKMDNNNHMVWGFQFGTHYKMNNLLD